MRNLVKIFEGVNVTRWEFGIQDPALNNYWALFQWIVAEGKPTDEGGLKMLVKERTRYRPRIIKPGDDLKKLLPEGWVWKRPPCMCKECEFE
jgi:hypothetical protein